MKIEKNFSNSFLKTPVVGWVFRHFEKYRQLNVWSFLWKFTLEGFIVAFTLSILLYHLFDDSPRADIQELYVYRAPYILFEVAVFAPIIETFLLQLIPVGIARLFRASFVVQLISAWIPFALLHFFLGATVGICAGLGRGFYLAFTYVHWRQDSRWTALWTTSVSHIMNNFVATSIALMSRYIVAS